MYMQKKVYVAPNFEVYNMEPESMLADSIKFEGGDGFGETDFSDPKDMSNKRQPDAPWSKSPWE